MPKEVYRVDFFVSASLDYTGKETAPQSDDEVEAIAELAAPKLKNIIQSLTDASARVDIVYAQMGSAELGLGGRSLYESYDDWIKAKDMLVDLVVKTEEWFAAELRIQEGLARERISVQARFYPPSSQASDPQPQPVSATAAPSLAGEVQQQFHRIIAVVSIAAFLALMFGVVLTGAVFGYSALREEVSLLRQEIATRAASNESPPQQQQQPIIVSSPPPQVTVIAPESPRSRTWRSQPR